MARLRCLNRLVLSIIFSFVNLPSIAILGTEKRARLGLFFFPLRPYDVAVGRAAGPCGQRWGRADSSARAPPGPRRAAPLPARLLPSGAARAARRRLSGFGRPGAYAIARCRLSSAGRGGAAERGPYGERPRRGTCERPRVRSGEEERGEPRENPPPSVTAEREGEMSNVRISNGSPTLERMEARQSEYPKPSACRNLFGPVNHEELNRDLKKHRKEMEEACQRKWNFDFQNHKPLEGRYEWQAVEKGSSPDFYFRPPRLPKAVCRSVGRQSLDVNGNCQTAICAASQGISEDTHCVGRKTDVAGSQTDFAEQCAGQRKRPAADGNVTPRAAPRAGPGTRLLPSQRPRCRPQHRELRGRWGPGARASRPSAPLSEERRGGSIAGLGAKLKRASLAEREACPCPPSRSPVADVGMRGCAGISPGPVAPPAPGCRASTLRDNILNQCSPPSPPVFNFPLLDSSPQNKRANTTEEEVSEDSPSASSVEQTPKKSSPRRHQT